jgi:hypothetical protein
LQAAVSRNVETFLFGLVSDLNDLIPQSLINVYCFSLDERTLFLRGLTLRQFLV